MDAGANLRFHRNIVVSDVGALHAPIFGPIGEKFSAPALAAAAAPGRLARSFPNR
jgi:hypothetical protein